MSVDKKQHLLESLETHKMRHIEGEVEAFQSKADEVKEKLESHYGSDMYYIFRSGSFAKHTAINIKYDIDLVVPFKYNKFDTLEAMYEDVYEYLKDTYRDGVTIRKQKVSIGLVFPMDGNGYSVKLDVVPGRELSEDDYPETKDLNLFFNEDHWGYKKGTRQKTNIQKQIDHISGKTEERKIIRLLKIWKNTNNQDYKSFMLELFTIKAMTSYSGDDNLWDKLKYVMTYIADHVTDEHFQLIDPGNTNNNVLSSMSSAKRSALSITMKSIVANIVADSNCISLYFPINAKYKKREVEYGNKNGSSGPSYPPTGQRFGR